jgi:hypothetical protein
MLEYIRKNDQRIFKDPKSDKNCCTTAEAHSLMEREILCNCERYVKLLKTCSKQRSRLSDRAINALCVLTFHFKNDDF